eukprot:15344958-Ditylum_brightwellii.AAC.1
MHRHTRRNPRGLEFCNCNNNEFSKDNEGKDDMIEETRSPEDEHVITNPNGKKDNSQDNPDYHPADDNHNKEENTNKDDRSVQEIQDDNSTGVHNGLPVVPTAMPLTQNNDNDSMSSSTDYDKQDIHSSTTSDDSDNNTNSTISDSAEQVQTYMDDFNKPKHENEDMPEDEDKHENKDMLEDDISNQGDEDPNEATCPNNEDSMEKWIEKMENVQGIIPCQGEQDKILQPSSKGFS